MNNLTVAGWPFARTCAREETLRREEWWIVDVAKGDASPGETANDRVRLDGWPQKIAAGKPFVIAFGFVPELGWEFEKAGNWTVLFELHAEQRKGDVGSSGPLKIEHTSHSNGRARLVANLQQPRFDAAGRLTGYDQNAIEIGPLVPGRSIEFRIEGLIGAAGYLRLLMDGRRVIDRASFGYGDRALWPQFGIYRNSRSTRQTARFRIDELRMA